MHQVDVLKTKFRALTLATIQCGTAENSYLGTPLRTASSLNEHY